MRTGWSCNLKLLLSVLRLYFLVYVLFWLFLLHIFKIKFFVLICIFLHLHIYCSFLLCFVPLPPSFKDGELDLIPKSLTLVDGSYSFLYLFLGHSLLTITYHGKEVWLCDLLPDTQSRERSGAHYCQGHTFDSKCNQVLMKSTHILDQFTSGMLSLSACYCKTFLLVIRLIENPIAVSTYIQMSTLPPFLIKLMEYMNYFKVDFPSIFSQIWIEIPE